MTKPSKWTIKEAFEAGRDAMANAIPTMQNWGYVGRVEVDRVRMSVMFPSDPVERVSDDTLRSWVKGAHGGDLQLMALELIERRKADRDPSVVGQHGEKR